MEVKWKQTSVRNDLSLPRNKCLEVVKLAAYLLIVTRRPLDFLLKLMNRSKQLFLLFKSLFYFSIPSLFILLNEGHPLHKLLHWRFLNEILHPVFEILQLIRRCNAILSFVCVPCDFDIWRLLVGLQRIILFNDRVWRSEIRQPALTRANCSKQHGVRRQVSLVIIVAQRPLNLPAKQ